MRLNFTLILFTFSILCLAQDFNLDMKVLKPELQQNFYAKDSTANALVIYDYGNSYVDKETFWLRFELKQKIKILRTEGIERGEIEVKLYKGKSSEEQILNIKGATYNLENGEMVKSNLTQSAIFKEENEKYTLVKFVLPNVKVGSIITYSYETKSRFMAKFQPWYFQGQDPVLYSEYNTSIPANYEYNIKLVGSKRLDVHDTSLDKHCIKIRGGASADCSVSKYIMKNIPAYKPEGFTTTPLNYIARIEYELSVVRGFDGSVDKITKSWEDVDKELKADKDFGKQISKKSLVKNLLPKEVTSINDGLEKAKAIYQYVLDNYKWNEKYERYDVSVKTTAKEKIGNAFEINLLLENLLSNQGYKVYPILVSTRANGLATKIFPVLTDFNYLILKTTINGKDYYLDATDPYLSFGELPYRCLNQYGRLIDFENGSYWENIKIEAYSTRQYRVELTSFTEEGFGGVIASKNSGYHAHSLKRNYYENPLAYKERKANIYSDITIEEHTVSELGKNNYDFEEEIQFTLEPEIIGNKVYLNPFITKFFDENPFKSQERTYPIDFGYKDVYLYTLNINLGESLTILEIPDSVNYKLPNKTGTFIFEVENKDNVLTLYFKVKFNKAIYGAEFYEYLKQFMNHIVKNQNNAVIVLEKA